MTDQEILNIIHGLQTSSGSSGLTDDTNTTQGGGVFGTPQPGATATPATTSGGTFGSPTPGLNPMEFFLRSTPGWQFAFSEGQRAAQTGAASKGTLLTGGTLKALARFGTGLADQTFNTAVDQRLRLSDIGARTAIAPF